jgi:hypothetical protein
LSHHIVAAFNRGRLTRMARTQYFVTLHEGQWKVVLNGKHYGPYETQKKRSGRQLMPPTPRAKTEETHKFWFKARITNSEPSGHTGTIRTHRLANPTPICVASS